MKNIYGITFEELENYFIERNDKKFKATQVFDWVYKKRIDSFDEMRKKLDEINAIIFSSCSFMDYKSPSSVHSVSLSLS